MSYQEKRIWLSIVTGIIILLSYCVFAFTKFSSTIPRIDDTRYWAGIMLWFIGIGVAVVIFTQIIYHILIAVKIAINERVESQNCEEKGIEKKIKNETVVDEMDKLIELKSMRIGFVITGLGFMLGLISLILNYSSVVMLNILFISFAIGSIIEGFSQIYFYRKGL